MRRERVPGTETAHREQDSKKAVRTELPKASWAVTPALRDVISVMAEKGFNGT